MKNMAPAPVIFGRLL